MKEVLLVYWSGTGNTARMAELIQKGIEEEGKTVSTYEVSSVNAKEVENYQTIVLGCPSMGAEELEESEMEPFVESLKDIVKEKKVALFGSYGWGSGEWMESWHSRMKGYGANLLFDVGLIILDAPEGDSELECIEYGKNIARVI